MSDVWPGRVGLGNLLILTIACVVYTAPLVVWRQSYHNSGAGWPVLVLGAIILSGAVSQRLALNRARLAAALRPESWLRGVLTGWAGAVLAGAGLVTVAVPVLAWTAHSATGAEIVALGALGLTSAVTCLASGRAIAAHFQPAHVRAWTVGFGTLAPAAMFLPVMVWINWALVQHPVAYADMGFLEALTYAPGNAPLLSGPDAAVMRLFQSAESLKLWLVHRFAGSAVPGLLYSLDAALVVLVVARSAVAVTDLVRHVASQMSGGDR